MEIQRGHDGGERSRGGLMAADFQAVDAVADVVGVMDGAAPETQHPALERSEDVEVLIPCGHPQTIPFNVKSESRQFRKTRLAAADVDPAELGAAAQRRKHLSGIEQSFFVERALQPLLLVQIDFG